MKDLTIAPRIGKRYFSVLEDFLETELPESFKTVMMKYAGLTVEEDRLDFNLKILFLHGRN